MKQYIYPWGYFEMDPDTGLPAAPEGMFFRVTQGFIFRRFWQVELRERTRFGSRCVETRVFDMYTASITEENVLDGAAHVLTKLREREPNNPALLGDYLPRKI